jgi:hypothetical protein
MKTPSADIIGTIPEDWARVRRSDLYALLDKLTSMQTGLVSLWDPDATIHPLTPAKCMQAREALNTAIADLRQWIEQEHSAGKRQYRRVS